MAYRLYAHQIDAVESALKHDSYAVFAETGTGKTIIGIELMQRLRAQYSWRTLIVCPLSCIELVWRPEIAKFAPHLKTVNLWKHRKDKVLPDGDVYVINYESVALLDPKLLASFRIVILDESTKIKNPRAQVTRFLLGMRKQWRHRFVFSGLPAPNGVIEYWSQMAFINPAILGDNFWRFRAINFFNLRNMPYLWRPTQEFKDRLPHLLARQAYVIKKVDCLDLPEKTYQVRGCQLSPSQRKAYDQMVKLNITTIKNSPVLAANELAKMMKLRQITSGFAVDAHGEVQELVDDSKLKLLDEVLDELGDKQVIIWVQFHKEIERIRALLEKHSDIGANNAVLAGTETQADKEQAVADFKAGRVQYLIAHPRTAGHGLTLVNCSYAIYYSMSYSLEEYVQSQDRIHRIGQTESVTYIHLAAEKTIDEVIYRALQKKESIAAAVLSMVRDLS